MKATIQERMAAVTNGQVSWPDLDVTGRWCMFCAHFDRENVKRPDPHKEWGQCEMVKKMTGKAGVQFKGAEAIACRMYREGRTNAK